MDQTKYCPHCKETKTLDLFRKAKTKSGVYGWCKSCCDIRDNLYRAKNIDKCRAKGRKYQQEHREERKKYHQRWYESKKINNPGFSSETHLKSRYGISRQAFQEMYDVQEGHCNICEEFFELGGSRKEYKSLVVDHNKETGQVRALLCHRCNLAIGLLKEDSERALKLAGYLMHYNGDPDAA